MTENQFKIEKNKLTGKWSYFYPTGLYPSIDAEDLLEVLISHLNEEYQCKKQVEEEYLDYSNEMSVLYEENQEIKKQLEKYQNEHTCMECSHQKYKKQDDGSKLIVCDLSHKINKLKNRPFSYMIKWNCPYFESK